MGTTIAGGLLSSPPGAAAAPSGPFGGSHATGVPLFGPPPAASSADIAVGHAAAELAAAGGSPAGEAGTAEAAKRKQGSLFEPEGAGGGSEPAEKRSRGEASPPAAAAADGTASGATPAQRPCATEAVQQYNGMDAVPLDPLALHRPFCPWVNQGQAAAEGQQPARCGWKWSLQQLMPGGTGFHWRRGQGAWSFGADCARLPRLRILLVENASHCVVTPATLLPLYAPWVVCWKQDHLCSQELWSCIVIAHPGSRHLSSRTLQVPTTGLPCCPAKLAGRARSGTQPS